MGNNLPDILESKGWTKYRLAIETGLSHPAILRIVNADEIPPKTTWDTIKKITAALDIRAEDLED